MIGPGAGGSTFRLDFLRIYIWRLGCSRRGVRAGCSAEPAGVWLQSPPGVRAGCSAARGRLAALVGLAAGCARVTAFGPGAIDRVRGAERRPRTPPARDATPERHPQDAPPGTPPYAAAFPQGAGPQAVSLQQARRARAPPRPGLPQADAAAKARPARMAAQPSNRPRYRHGSPPELQIPPHELEQIGRPIPTRAR